MQIKNVSNGVLRQMIRDQEELVKTAKAAGFVVGGSTSGRTVADEVKELDDLNAELERRFYATNR